MTVEAAIEAVSGAPQPMGPEHAIPVRIIEGSKEQFASSQHAAWGTYVLQGTEAPFQLLPQDAKRHRALIWAVGTAGNAVKLVRQRGASNATATNNVGAVLMVGGPAITYEGSSEVWIAPAGTIVTVCFLDERYE